MAHLYQVIDEGDRPSSQGPLMANQAGATNTAYSSYYVGGNVAETQPPERVVIEGENQAHAVNTPLGRPDTQNVFVDHVFSGPLAWI
jgi:hypothetical protein